MKNIITILIFLIAETAYSQSAKLTPIKDLGTHTVSVTVPAKFTNSFPAGKKLIVPTRYTVSVFQAGGLTKPRFMTFSPKGVLYVADQSAGKIFALPDTNNDGIADKIIEAASGFTNSHDLKFYKGAMYVTETTKIWKCIDANNDGIYETKTVFISNIGNNTTGNHVTRTIVFDSLNKKVYVSVGSSCNVCREDNRAIIEQYNEDGTGRRVFASGTRNAVGMALHPVTNRLWANNNGSDNQGNEIPPEWIDIVKDNGFYGHPFAYGSGVWFNFNTTSEYQNLLPITKADSQKVAKMIMPAALIRAHYAPMAIQFLNSQFGPNMQYGFITALRGSWNATNPKAYRGYKVIYGHLSSAQDTTVDYVGDFCTGFLTDTTNGTNWGRPVGLAIDANGKVYISSDESNKCILVLTPDNNSGMNKENENKAICSIYPNPAKDQFILEITLSKSENVTAILYDITGKEIMKLLNQSFPSGKSSHPIDIHRLTAGNYILKVSVGNNTSSYKLMKD